MPKVMVVDDDHTMVTLLKTLLEMEGFEVVDAARRESVVEGIRIERPDLVLMDVFLSNEDGIQVLEQLRASPELAGVRVVMTSGMNVSAESEAAGADRFLLKPYTPEHLIEVIREVTGEGKVSS